MGASPVSVPTGSPGKSANALAQVREAIKILEKALPELPAGSAPYNDILASISKISKHVSPSDEIPGLQKTALRGLAQDAQKSAMMQSLMRSMGEGGAAPPSPGGAPQPPTPPPA
jgi:hypothetical protein